MTSLQLYSSVSNFAISKSTCNYNHPSIKAGGEKGICPYFSGTEEGSGDFPRLQKPENKRDQKLLAFVSSDTYLDPHKPICVSGTPWFKW